MRPKRDVALCLELGFLTFGKRARPETGDCTEFISLLPHDSAELYFDLNCMEKGPAPEAAERDSHAAEARCGFVLNLFF